MHLSAETIARRRSARQGALLLIGTELEGRAISMRNCGDNNYICRRSGCLYCWGARISKRKRLVARVRQLPLHDHAFVTSSVFTLRNVGPADIGIRYMSTVLRHLKA